MQRIENAFKVLKMNIILIKIAQKLLKNHDCFDDLMKETAMIFGVKKWHGKVDIGFCDGKLSCSDGSDEEGWTESWCLQLQMLPPSSCHKM